MPTESATDGIRPEGIVVLPAGDRAADLVPRIAIDSLRDKRQFLEFWGLTYDIGTDGDADVSLISADSWELRVRNAVVLLPGTGGPGLFRTDDGSAFYAPIRRIGAVPDGMEAVSRILDDRGRTVSYILHDPESRTFYLPFSLDQAFDGFQLERYTRNRRFPPDELLRIYYALKPLLPRALLARARRMLSRVQERSQFPEWPIDLSFERLRRTVLILLLRASRSGTIPFIWFWPAGREYCVVLTHDVECGLADNPGIWRLLGAEKALGLKSSFNVVPFKYPVDTSLLDRLRAEGCEVGVHGYSHDGTLFRDKRRFPERIREINEIARRWGARGFRSASTYRDADMLRSLEFEYDLSFFDTDPFEPQPGGCLSLFPYCIGDLVEIPMTLPQDHTVFVIRKEHDDRLWREKLAVIRDLGGLACLNAHPDEGYVGDETLVDHYRDFLGVLADDDSAWNPLAGELARWWRLRRSARIVEIGGSMAVCGGDDRMEIRTARLLGGELVFDRLADRH